MSERDEFLPNAPRTGQIGTETYPWGKTHTEELYVGGDPVDPAEINTRLDDLEGSTVVTAETLNW